MKFIDDIYRNCKNGYEKTLLEIAKIVNIEAEKLLKQYIEND